MLLMDVCAWLCAGLFYMLLIFCGLAFVMVGLEIAVIRIGHRQASECPGLPSHSVEGVRVFCQAMVSICALGNIITSCESPPTEPSPMQGQGRVL